MTTPPTPAPRTPPPSTPPPRPDESPTPPAQAGAPVGLAARAIAAHHLARRHDPRGYPRRHDDWRTWARRQHGAAALAGVLGVPVEHVRAGDDVERGYGINHQYPGDLYTVTDPHTATRWRFIPDFLAEHSWLLLGHCPRCPSPSVPVAHIAGLADLGAFHAPLPGLPDPALPDIAHGDPAHRPGCPYTAGRI